jgi:hypothetical protein
MKYICKTCGSKEMSYAGGENQKHTGLEPGYYKLSCGNCGNTETHTFREPDTIQGQLHKRVLQDF